MKDWLTVITGDCRDILPTLPDESVHCVVTSPPYWGLRDYGTATWEGGDADCDHEPDKRGSRFATPVSAKQASNTGSGTISQRDCRCGARRIDRQLGLEPTPEEYVEQMVAVFREVRRVLRSDGTVWLNLGDSYNAGRDGGWPGGKAQWKDDRYVNRSGANVSGLKPKDLVGIPWRVAFALQADGWYLRSDIIWAKPNPMPESVTDRPTKSHEYVFLLAKGQWKRRRVQVADLPDEPFHLSGYSWTNDTHMWADQFGVRLAAAILDGTKGEDCLSLLPLYAQVGQQRTNGRDRLLVGDLPTVERLATFARRLAQSDMTTKQFLGELHSLGLDLRERDYLRVGDGAAEVLLPPGVDAYGDGAVAIHDSGKVGEFELRHGSIIAAAPSTCTYYFDQEAVREDGAGRLDLGRMKRPEARLGEGGVWANDNGYRDEAGRNIRSVWSIATQPYPGAHFAVFPEALVEPCVKAGTSERGVCPECGAPWERVVADRPYPKELANAAKAHGGVGNNLGGQRHQDWLAEHPRETTGWRATCSHDSMTPVHSVVLDPFAGSGTVGVVANRLSRRAVLIELNPDYIEQVEKRNAQAPLGLTA